jgi:hypothetical protein
VLRRRGEDGDDERGRAKRVPPHRDIVEVLEEAHPKGVDHACSMLGQSSTNQGRLTLSEQDSGIDPDRLARAGLEIGTEGACGGDKVGTCEARVRRRKLKDAGAQQWTQRRT